jgi:flagellar basal-body rod protein FlgF
MTQQLFYIVAAGLNATTDRITAATNNLANTNTIGFKAQRPVFQAEPLVGQGLPDRVQVASREDTADFRAGAIEQTGRSLDVAVNGNGWIAVQAADGSVALTRNGSLSVSANGVLQTSDGHPVLGDGLTPVTLPPLQSVTIGQDGTVSGTPAGQTPDQVAAVNRIMLVNPPVTTLRRGTDGLFRTDTKPTADAQVQLQSGALETSNADSVSMMMTMIENTRTFQMQTELMHRAANAGQGQSSPLTLT